MLSLVPTYATNLTSDDLGSEADQKSGSALALTAVLRHALLEAEACPWGSAHDGHGRLPDLLQPYLRGRTQAGGTGRHTGA